MKYLTPDQKKFYDEQGYIIIEDFLNKKELNFLLTVLDKLVEEKARNLDQDAGGFNLEKVKTTEEVNNFKGPIVAPGLLRKIQEITDYSPEFKEFVESDKMLNLVEDLVGPRLFYHSSKLMFKPAHHGQSKPWHQDYAYWASTAPEQVTCWMALDDATIENGCMQLIPGSHKWGLMKHIREELQIDLKNIPQEKVKIAPMKAGSILAFHVLTLHHSGPNNSDKSRRALIADYDPNPRPSKTGGFAGDRLLRIDGRKPTAEEVARFAATPETVGAK
jgi:ectoine hydroxylase-related dioxygenase (phytanoyl-CoA dioxygenase family)